MKRYKKPAKSRAMQILAGTRPTSLGVAIKFTGISAKRLKVRLPYFLGFLIKEKERIWEMARDDEVGSSDKEVL